ncbi:MAG: c-type cytochrome [bacterium]
MSIGRLVIALILLVAVGSATAGWLVMSHRQAQNRIEVAYPEGVAAVVPLGISAGQAPTLNIGVANPLADDPNSVQDGKKLFRTMNCASCHGYGATGGMGPNLTDTAWRYGGTPIEVYKSIYEGRPQGMPAWGNALPPQTVWQLVAYIQSLGGTFAARPVSYTSPSPANPDQASQTGQKQ